MGLSMDLKRHIRLEVAGFVETIRRDYIHCPDICNRYSLRTNAEQNACVKVCNQALKRCKRAIIR